MNIFFFVKCPMHSHKTASLKSVRQLTQYFSVFWNKGHPSYTLGQEREPDMAK